MLADLHTHSTISDGILSPSELVQLAKKESLGAIALTDHDTVDGIDAALEAGRKSGLIVIPGIELSTQLENYEIHILGYYVDYKNKRFISFLKKYSQARLDRGRKIVEKLTKIGIILDWESILLRFGQGSVGRLHIARTLLEKGYVNSIDEAFRKYLIPGAPAFVSRLKLDPLEAIKMIKAVGGIPVLAHPGILGSNSIIKELISYGIMGVEVYYPLHTASEIKHFLSLCKEYDLLPTGGSDFHGIGTESKKKLGLASVDLEVVKRMNKLRKC
jgi:predicted metal-dependent phosphoesterase TrpH